METHLPKPPALEPSNAHMLQLSSFPPVPTAPLRPSEAPSLADDSPKNAMDIDNIVSPDSRQQRASSVTSRLSMEDLQAAETLEFLKNGK